MKRRRLKTRKNERLAKRLHKDDDQQDVSIGRKSSIRSRVDSSLLGPQFDDQHQMSHSWIDSCVILQQLCVDDSQRVVETNVALYLSVLFPFCRSFNCVKRVVG